MNGKQAKMLRKMRATNKEKRTWLNLPAKMKGEMRYFYENNPKMVFFSFQQSIESLAKK